MKKFNLLRKTILLLLTITIFSFVTKNKNHPKTQISQQYQYKDRIFVQYAPGTSEQEKNQIRACIGTNLNDPIASINSCPNTNGEIIVFQTTVITPTVGGGFGGADDEELEQTHLGTIKKVITEQELLQILAPCGGNFTYSLDTSDCNTTNNLLFGW